MDSKLLVTIHLIAVNLFLLLYLVKTVLLFTSPKKLDGFARVMKVPEMLISVTFLGTGVWLFAILGAIKTLQIIKLAFVMLAIPLAVVGFKKHKKGLALLAFLLVVGAYGMSEAARNKPYIPARVEISSNLPVAGTEGVQLYMSHCAMCHGSNGDKEYRGAALLSATHMDSTASAMIIKAGVIKGMRGTMPSFEHTLSDEQVHVIAAYIQGLKK